MGSHRSPEDPHPPTNYIQRIDLQRNQYPPPYSELEEPSRHRRWQMPTLPWAPLPTWAWFLILSVLWFAVGLLVGRLL